MRFSYGILGVLLVVGAAGLGLAATDFEKPGSDRATVVPATIDEAAAPTETPKLPLSTELSLSTQQSDATSGLAAEPNGSTFSAPVAVEEGKEVEALMAQNETTQNDTTEKTGSTAKASASASASASSSAKSGTKAGGCVAESSSDAQATVDGKTTRDSDHDRQVAEGDGCSAKAEASSSATAGKPDGAAE